MCLFLSEGINPEYANDFCQENMKEVKNWIFENYSQGDILIITNSILENYFKNDKKKFANYLDNSAKKMKLKSG